MLHRLVLVAGSWEVTVFRHVWALPRAFGSGSSRAGVFQGSKSNIRWCSVEVLSFSLISEVTGSQVEPVHRPLVVAGHAHLWFLRWPLWFVPAAS